MRWQQQLSLRFCDLMLGPSTRYADRSWVLPQSDPVRTYRRRNGATRAANFCKECILIARKLQTATITTTTFNTLLLCIDQCGKCRGFLEWAVHAYLWCRIRTTRRHTMMCQQ